MKKLLLSLLLTLFSINALSAPIKSEITDTGVVAGQYGSATQIPVIDINSVGQITGASNVSIISSGGLAAIQVFTSSGTYTKTAGVTKALVKLMGGGAGGGGGGAGESGVSNDGGGGGGGASGNYLEAFIDSGIGATETVNVGAGGLGGDGGETGGAGSNGQNGQNGGASSFGSFVSTGNSTGGSGAPSNGSGSGANGGIVATPTGTYYFSKLGYEGGDGGDAGNDGQGILSGSSDNNYINLGYGGQGSSGDFPGGGAAGASSIYGAGGGGGNVETSGVAPGGNGYEPSSDSYGAGGGGGAGGIDGGSAQDGGQGGDGAPGFVIIYEFY